MLTSDQWDKVQSKYQRLMYAVSHRIGGDKVTHDFDDTQQELAITVMDAVAAYGKKTEKSFDEFFGTKEFDKYIKTCLWNRKNNLGCKIKKKYEIRKCVSLSENPDTFGSFDTTSTDSSLEEPEPTISAFNDVELDDVARSVSNIVMGDLRLIKPNGSINVCKVAQLLNVPKSEVYKAIEQLKFKLKDYND